MSEHDPLLAHVGPRYGEIRGASIQSEHDDNSDKPPQEYKVYKRRWYILFVYSMLAFTQSFSWNTWGPIASSAKFAYGWSNAVISLLISWGPIMFMATVFPYSWLIETKGLRWATIVGASFLAAGGIVRCITQEPPYVSWLMNVGQICVSITGPMAVSAVTSVSAAWFPPSQRTTATALSTRLMAVGNGLAFILGPYLVTDIDTISNSTIHYNRTEVEQEIKNDIRNVMYIELGLAASVLIAVLCYFPSKPPTPPSASVTHLKPSFTQGVKNVAKKGNFWLLGFPYAFSYGTMVGWNSTLDVNLQNMGISQKEAGWIGIAGTIAGQVTAILLAMMVDKLRGRTKPTLIGLYIAAACGTLLFALDCSYLIPYNKASLYIGRIIGFAAFSSLPPLVFETLCEACFPVPESITNALITLMKNFWLFVFLAILWIPSVGTVWMNWMVVGVSVFCIPLVILFKERRGRLELDYAQQNQPPVSS